MKQNIYCDLVELLRQDDHCSYGFPCFALLPPVPDSTQIGTKWHKQLATFNEEADTFFRELFGIGDSQPLSLPPVNHFLDKLDEEDLVLGFLANSENPNRHSFDSTLNISSVAIGYLVEKMYTDTSVKEDDCSLMRFIKTHPLLGVNIEERKKDVLASIFGQREEEEKIELFINQMPDGTISIGTSEF